MAAFQFHYFKLVRARNVSSLDRNSCNDTKPLLIVTNRLVTRYFLEKKNVFSKKNVFPLSFDRIRKFDGGTLTEKVNEFQSKIPSDSHALAVSE